MEGALSSENITKNIVPHIKKFTDKPSLGRNEFSDLVLLAKDLLTQFQFKDISQFNDALIETYINRNYRDSAKLGKRLQNTDVSPQELSVTDLLMNLNDRIQTLVDLTNAQYNKNATGVKDDLHNQYFIHINSLNRDPTSYTDPSNYKFTLQQTQVGQTRGYVRNLPQLKNIITIELISCTVPNFYKNNSINGFATPFMYLKIDEIEGDVYSSFYDFRPFAKLEFRPEQTTTSSDFLLVDTENYKYVKVYSDSSAFSSLNSLTFTFVDQAGNNFDFGNDAIAITSISAANPTVVTTSTAHGLQKGDLIFIVGHISTGGTTTQQTTANQFLNSASGVQVNSVTSSTTFTISFNNQAGGGATGMILIGRLQNDLTLRITTLK
jgi:hypothetical protein